MTAINADWRFSRKSFSDVDQEVTEADLFNTEKVEIGEALVREATQNSQDAAVDSSETPVRLRIAYVEGDALDQQLLSEMTSGLAPHLTASGFEAPSNKPPSALIIEDFGTRGLTGRTDDASDDGNYRSFWFRHGGSRKAGGKGGRWGLGKLVFPVSSALRCFFALTIREDAPRELLLGQSVLKVHPIGEDRFAPHGHFGIGADGERIMPVTDQAFLERVKKGFGLERTDEAGLSVIVPCPVQKPDRDTLLRFVVQNYAFPILTGRLEVDVLGTVVNASTVRELGEGLLKPGLVSFIDASHAFAEADLVRIPEVPYENGFAIRETLFTSEQLQTLRQRYIDGDLIGLRLPVRVRSMSATNPADTYVDIFLKRALDGEDGDAICIRGDITVPGEAQRFSGPEHFALLRADDGPVSEFLGDAENPAHTLWSARADRFVRRWQFYPGQTLSLIRNAPAALHRILASGQQTADPNALISFFWVDQPVDEGGGGVTRPRRRPKKDVVITVPPAPTPPQAQRRLRIDRQAGGFAVVPGPDFGLVALPARLRVEVAYDVEHGNALKKWEPFDFDLGAKDSDILIATEGAVAEGHGKRIEIDIDSADFSLRVTGFDPRRDLVVQSTWLKTVNSDA